jgi:hypothetical protein
MVKSISNVFMDFMCNRNLKKRRKIMEISEQCRNCGRTFDDYIKAFPKILDCPGYTQHYIEESSFAEEGKCLHRISLDEAKRQLDIIHERKEKNHWFITVYPQLIEGRCSDGRTFGQPCGLPQIWVHGFTTALDMSGQTYEIREEE